MQGTIQPYADNLVIVIPVEYLLHRPDKPFYWDMKCPCKADQEAFWQLQGFIKDGLMTVDEATLFYCGKTV